MSKYTPGPWRYDGRAYIFGPNTEMIAMIRGTGEALPEDENARLIAAAPELLEAASRALDHMLFRGWAVQADHELRDVYEQLKGKDIIKSVEICFAYRAPKEAA